MGLVYHQWRQTVLWLLCISNMFVLSSYLLKVRHALRKPTRCAKKAEKMRLRFALSSAGCVVLSLFLVVAEAQDSESARVLARHPHSATSAVRC